MSNVVAGIPAATAIQDLLTWKGSTKSLFDVSRTHVSLCQLPTMFKPKLKFEEFTKIPIKILLLDGMKLCMQIATLMAQGVVKLNIWFGCHVGVTGYPWDKLCNPAWWCCFLRTLWRRTVFAEATSGPFACHSYHLPVIITHFGLQIQGWGCKLI